MWVSVRVKASKKEKRSGASAKIFSHFSIYSDILELVMGNIECMYFDITIDLKILF